MTYGHMAQCESCIQKKKKKNKNKRKIKKGEKAFSKSEREKKKIFFSLLSNIYGNWTVGFRRSKRQSRSTHRELCVGTKILSLVKLHEVGNFST